MRTITPAFMNALGISWNGAYKKGFGNAKSQYQEIAMVTKSTNRESVYGWLGQMPMLREWLGDRIITGLQSFGFSIENKDFEMTISVSRNDVEDDQVGLYGPMFEELGRTAALHPDQLVFSLFKAGFTSKCYDNQNFFDSDHPTFDEGGETVTTSNMQDGAGPAWYLIDTSRAVRPIIFQERRPYTLLKKDNPQDDNVFWDRNFIYGVDGRANAGFGMWQLAYASKAALTPENIVAAQAAMRVLRGNQGQLIGIEPDTLLVPPSLDADGREALKANLENGESNILNGQFKQIMSPWLA